MSSASLDQLHLDTMAVLMELPLVKSILSEKNKLREKCKNLRRENKALRNLILSLPEFRCACAQSEKKSAVSIKTENTQTDVPMPCEPLVDNDEVVYIESSTPAPNIVFVIDDEELPTTGLQEEEIEGEEEEEVEEEEAEEEEAEEEEAEEEEEEEEEAEEEEEEEEEAEEEEAEEEEAEEKEAEEEEAEEKEAEEEEAEESEDEVFEITIKGKSYYTTNATNGKIYSIEKDESVGDEVGVFENGKANFNKKK
jgi:hypothetical protein